jgi:monofunctional biosynthetic peptidoglycan transglycosylase
MKRVASRAYRVFKWALIGVLGMVLLWHFWLFGWVLWWNWVDPVETNFQQIRMAELREKKPDARMKQQWVPYDRISNSLKRAILASEDAKFVDHEGFDWDGIQKALEKNRKKGKSVAGGSTISQQLAKNLFLSPRRSMVRKAEEAVITVMIETVWNKQRILEVYLNVIEWGNGVFGAEAAARHYYGVGADRLSAEQSARLAGMVPNPRFYDRNRSAPGLARKAEIILSRMADVDLP